MMDFSLEGYLTKRGEKNTHSWKRRWFVAGSDGRPIEYYKDETKAKLIGDIPLEDATVRRGPKENSFEIVCQKRIWLLVAADSMEMHKWMAWLTDKSNVSDANNLITQAEDMIISYTFSRDSALSFTQKNVLDPDERSLSISSVVSHDVEPSSGRRKWRGVGIGLNILQAGLRGMRRHRAVSNVDPAGFSFSPQQEPEPEPETELSESDEEPILERESVCEDADSAGASADGASRSRSQTTPTPPESPFEPSQ